jgi:hypothetical protein
MSRTIQRQDIQTRRTETCSTVNRTCLITASNTQLIVKPGYDLAIVDKNGEVVQQGDSVKSEVFKAMTTQVIEQFCNRFSTFTEADFRKSA